jgi:hypothetical protein
MKCPEFSEILDFIDNKLQPGAKKKIESHLKNGCEQCQLSLKKASEIIQLMKSDQMTKAPDYVVQKAISLFPSGRTNLLDWVKAKLDFDSWTAPELAGVRSMDRGPRHLSYTTDHYKIVLLLQTSKEGTGVTGQLIPKESASESDRCLVEVSSKNRIVASQYTNDQGEFWLGTLPVKKFDLLIHGDSEAIRISL